MFVPPEGNGLSIAAYAELESVHGPLRAQVRFSLFDLNGTTAIATATSQQATLPNAGTITVSARIEPPPGAVKPWSTKQPNMYSVLAEVMAGGEAVVDSVRTSVGFRTTTSFRAGANRPLTPEGLTFVQGFRGAHGSAETSRLARPPPLYPTGGLDGGAPPTIF